MISDTIDIMKGALSGGIMSEKELRRLSRSDLLELLIEQSEEIEELKRKLERATLALEQKEILISNSGSIAEAALRLNGVFEAADAATRQYIENVRINTKQRNTLIEHIETIEIKLKESVSKRIAETEAKCRAMEEETERRCKAMLFKAKSSI